MNTRSIHFIAILFSAILFSACTTTENMHISLKASLDMANTREAGPSRVEYDSKTGANVMIYDQYLFDKAENQTHWSSEREVFDTARVNAPGPQFGLGAGLEYIAKGASYQQGGGTLGLNYIEVPIHFLYNYPLGPGKLYGGIGPYFAYAIGGEIKGNGFSQSSFGESNGGYKRFDAGLGFMAGYQLSLGWSLDLSYDLGLANVYSQSDVSSHNRCFSINLGYEIGRLFVRK